MKSTKQSQENPISRALTLMRQCPVCETKYSKEMFQHIDQNDGAHLLHCTCQHCHQSILALVMTSPMGISSVGMVTDLTADDVTKISRKQSISEEELLSFHSLLTRQHVFEQSVLALYQQ